MKIFVGLGNPGLKYATTRHNVGFRVLDCLNTKLNSSFVENKSLQANIARTTFNSMVILLVKPTTFMNHSGECVAAIQNWFKVDLKDFLIIHDDVSLPLGKIRLQKDGSAGGQHGVESIIEKTGGAKNFNRLKIGIGPDPGGEDRAHYVLSPISLNDQPLLERVLKLSEEAAWAWFEEGIEKTMNNFNGMNLADLEQS